MRKNVSVVLTAQYTTECTKKVLLGYNAQTYRNFEVLLVIPSSDTEILKVLETLKTELFFNVTTVSVENEILSSDDFRNVVDATRTEYVIFAPASGIPRYDFVEQHVKYREEGFFLSGNYNQIVEKTLEKINENTINSGICFNLSWLKKNGFSSKLSDTFRFSEGLSGALFNKIFNSNLVFNFVNSSLWKEDLVLILNTLTAKKQENLQQEITNAVVALPRKGKQLKFSTVLLLPKKG